MEKSLIQIFPAYLVIVNQRAGVGSTASHLLLDCPAGIQVSCLAETMNGPFSAQCPATSIISLSGTVQAGAPSWVSRCPASSQCRRVTEPAPFS